MAGRIRRAADLIRRRNKPPSAKDILSGKIPANSRPVGAKSGYQIGDALRAAIAAGDIPDVDLSKSYKSDKDAKAAQDRMLARSKGFIESIRRRLTGDVLGGPQLFKDDYERLGQLDALAEALRLKDSAIARKRADIKKRLEGQVGLLRRAVLATGEKALGAIEGGRDAVKSVIGRLTGDTLKQKLAGFDLLPKGEIPTDPVDLPGFRKTTPTQRQQMTGVSSSNVASIGWEPHNQQSAITSESLGTLFIQFRNGWLYQYRDAPQWLHEALLRAPSKGKAVWALIRRGLYPDGIPYGSVNREGYERIR